MFFSPLGEKLFYVTMIVYLYGDLCIYAVAVPKSLVSVACDATTSPHHHKNVSEEWWGPLGLGNGEDGAAGERLGYSIDPDVMDFGPRPHAYMGGVIDFRDMEYYSSAHSEQSQPKTCLWGISDKKAYYFFLGIFSLTLASKPLSFFVCFFFSLPWFGCWGAFTVC